MVANEQDFTLDLDKIIRDNAGSKAKFIPKFVVSWLKKTIHQDEMNEFLTTDAKGKYGMDFLDACVKYLRMNLKVRTNIDGIVTDGLDAIPDNEEGRYYTIVSNHPLGGLDGIALGSVVCHKYDSKMVYLVRGLLMNLKGLAPLCIPINTAGPQSRDFPKMVEAAFKAEKNIVMFPAGLCSRKQNDGSIKDIVWKKTFITKSVQYHHDVIPVHFSGSNSNKFYNIARWCKKLHIKVNIAQLYLVDEMYKNAGKDFTVTFGKPIPWQTFDKSKTHYEWAQWVREKVYELDK